VEAVSNIILYHHERWDGSGYPMGLKGDEIPMGARILSVIDAFQSMTLGRPYRTRKTTETALAELVEHSGTQFDRDVVEAFVGVLKEDGKLAARDERDLVRRLREVPVGASHE
jgi:HD-GYP domain-containing protein (c-di-GMP phosphodiesterase class II)